MDYWRGRRDEAVRIRREMERLDKEQEFMRAVREGKNMASSKWKVVRKGSGQDARLTNKLFSHELQAIGYAQALNDRNERADTRYVVEEVPDETYWRVRLYPSTGRWSAVPDYSPDNEGLTTMIDGALGWHRVLAASDKDAIEKCKQHVLKWTE